MSASLVHRVHLYTVSTESDGSGRILRTALYSETVGPTLHAIQPYQLLSIAMKVVLPFLGQDIEADVTHSDTVTRIYTSALVQTIADEDALHQCSVFRGVQYFQWRGAVMSSFTRANIYCPSRCYFCHITFAVRLTLKALHILSNSPIIMQKSPYHLHRLNLS